jgi:transcriptional regulator with XRE-family HTH domain
MERLNPADMLKRLRLSYKGQGGRPLTQKELAAMAGIKNPETVSKIERGNQNITAEQCMIFARIFNVDPAVFVSAAGDGADDYRGVAEEATPFQPEEGSFEAHFPLKPTQSWYRIADSRLEEIGLMPGDAVVIDIGKEAMSGLAIGDVVIANLYSADGKSAETIVRQWLPPYLLTTNSRKRNLPPLNIEHDNVSLLGVIVFPRRNPQQKIIPFLR